jgi:hypothetical protein
VFAAHSCRPGSGVRRRDTAPAAANRGTARTRSGDGAAAGVFQEATPWGIITAFQFSYSETTGEGLAMPPAPVMGA